MKIYLAGMFSTIAQRRTDAKKFRAAGIEVVSRWLDETVPHNVSMKDCPTEYHQETSRADLDDIENCEIFVLFVPTDIELADTPARSLARGGRHFEMGYAWGLGRPIYVIGDRENIFHYLPGVEHFKTVDEVLTALLDLHWKRDS